MSKNKAYKTLKYSIRQCNEEEIEIRNAFFDGYPRGFIRLLFIGVFYMDRGLTQIHGLNYSL